MALPWTRRPPHLDGTLAGDAGFDPLHLAASPARLAFMAEAEVKHARLAMLCAAGIPLAELWHPGLAATLGLGDALVDGRAPTIPNGGLAHFAPFMLVAFAGAAAVEALTSEHHWFAPLQKQLGVGSPPPEGYHAGELGFDPLGLYTVFGQGDEARKVMRTAEIKNGRTAMVGVLAYVCQELVQGTPVVAQTPILFKPFWLVVASALGANLDEQLVEPWED